MMLGIMFGYMFYMTGSLWVPVWAHLINNGAAVTVAYLSQQGILTGDYENFGATSNVILILLSGLAIAAIFFVIYRLRPAENTG